MCTRMIPLLARLITVVHLSYATCVSELPIPLFTQITSKRLLSLGFTAFHVKYPRFRYFSFESGISEHEWFSPREPLLNAQHHSMYHILLVS
jgi:hypothetical protein